MKISEAFDGIIDTTIDLNLVKSDRSYDQPQGAIKTYTYGDIVVDFFWSSNHESLTDFITFFNVNTSLNVVLTSSVVRRLLNGVGYVCIVKSDDNTMIGGSIIKLIESDDEVLTEVLLSSFDPEYINTYVLRRYLTGIISFTKRFDGTVITTPFKNNVLTRYMTRLPFVEKVMIIRSKPFLTRQIVWSLSVNGTPDNTIRAIIDYYENR